ncbi:MAG: MFS transporter [Thermoleophilia bacterium]
MSTTERRSGNVTLALLAVVAVSYVLQQTLVVPALPSLQRDLHTTNTWVTWVFTGFLLTSAICTPLLGKLGDMHGKKRMLVVSIAVFGVGTVLCALSGSIAMLIAARGLQGAGGAIFPLSFGIIRDELPRERVGVGLGLLSATFGVGGGAGLVLSGVILQHLSWPWLFWIGAMPVVVSVVLVARLIPESPVRTPSKLDLPGAVVLSGALAALLVALSEGERWGWLSVTTLGVFALAAVLTVVWVLIELRVDSPMVDIAMMRDRAVLWTNVGAFLTGVAMFGTFLLVPTFVQMPSGLPPALAGQVHYGFHASVIEAGLFLLPSSLVMLVVGPVGGVAERVVGARVVCAGGLVLLAVGAALLTFAHDQAWEITVAMAVVGGGVGLAYAMLAKLIVDAVEPRVTGVAMGMNTVMRTIGGVVGGQVGAAILSAMTIGSTSLPAERGFTTSFAGSAIVALVAALGIAMVPRAPRMRVLPIAEPAVAAAGE